jgi:hypothetical protein
MKSHAAWYRTFGFVRTTGFGFAAFNLCALLSLAGCEQGGDDKSARIGAGQLKQSKLARLEVKLPQSPSFNKDHAPKLYPDQTLSIYGLRKDAKTFLNKTVRVKAYLLEVYKCPKCPKGAKCKECTAPHFYLSDKKNGTKDKALMVTDYPEKDEKTRRKLKFNEGERYIITGLFTKRSGTGFSHSEGLMVYRDSLKEEIK